MLDRLIFSESETMEVGQEVTINYGSDSHPAKIESIERVKGGYEISLREYHYHRDKELGGEMGHQNWVIDWDKPYSGLTKFKVNLKGKVMKKDELPFSSVSMGYARAYYCWEF